MLKGLFHIHTKYSFDSIMSPEAVVKYAVKNGYSILAITDHNTIRGSLEARSYVERHHSRIEAIIGAEYSTEKGDIIGLLLKEEIKMGSAEEVIGHIRAQGGLVVLPHPYKGHHLDTELIDDCDIVEVYNSRADELQNRTALEMAHTYTKPALVGSDAHFHNELGLATVTFTSTSSMLRDILLNSERYFDVAPSRRYFIIASQLIKSCKTRGQVHPVKPS